MTSVYFTIFLRLSAQELSITFFSFKLKIIPKIIISNSLWKQANMKHIRTKSHKGVKQALDNITWFNLKTQDGVEQQFGRTCRSKQVDGEEFLLCKEIKIDKHE